MLQKILENINSPESLEKLYRENKKDFIQGIKKIEEENQPELIRFWKIRLSNELDNDFRGIKMLDLFFVVMISLISGFLVKLPELFSQINEESFYQRDLAIIVFNGLILYTIWQNKIFDFKRLSFYGVIITILTAYINLLPCSVGDSVALAFIYTPLLLWCLFGLTFISFETNNIRKKIDFIRFNGEFVIMTGLLMIAGGLLTAITLGLFSAININIEEFYTEYVVVFGGVAAPIVSSFLIKIYPNLTSKIAPVIARVFTPLVLITLIIYLISILMSQSKIIEDRDLLIIFNVMLIAVMAIIFFSITELDRTKDRNFNILILLILAIVTVIINSIALVAITTRLGYGITPNRLVVMVSNVLIFINLILLCRDLFKAYKNSEYVDTIEKTVARYLLIYAVWTVIVVFIIPLLFGFK